ncbi:hypothetical protein D3C80_606470 [compost metagenome]
MDENLNWHARHKLEISNDFLLVNHINCRQIIGLTVRLIYHGCCCDEFDNSENLWSRCAVKCGQSHSGGLSWCYSIDICRRDPEFDLHVISLGNDRHYSCACAYNAIDRMYLQVIDKPIDGRTNFHA